MNEKRELETHQEQYVIPPRARNINQLLPVEDANPIHPSSHEVSLMRKTGKMDSHSNDKLFFFKKHSPDSRRAELEAYCGDLCKFLAGSEYVPTTQPYCNDAGNIIGVTSKAIKGFYSNQEKPLTEEDTLIQSVTIKINHTERMIEQIANKLLARYNQELNISQRSEFYAFLEDNYHALMDSEATPHYIRACLITFLGNSRDYSDLSLNTLLTQLKKRKPILDRNFEHDAEMDLIKQLRQALSSLRELYRIDTSENKNIELYEKIDRTFKKQNINIDAFDYASITREIDGISYTISLQDLKNYRMLKGQAVSLSTRYIFREGDANNSNMSKKGEFFDFGWTKANIMAYFMEYDEFNALFRHPTETSFACDEHNIQYFPDVDDPSLFFWPAKQPEIHRLIFNYMTRFLHRLEATLFEERHSEEANLPLKNVIHKILRVYEILATLNPAPVSNTYYQSTVAFLHWGLIQFEAIKQGRPAQELLDEAQIKYIFSALTKHITQLNAEVSNWADKIDKKDLTSFVSSIENEFDETIACKINQLRSTLGCLSVEISDVLYIFSKHTTIIQNENPLLDSEKIAFLFEGIEALFVKIESEIDRSKNNLKLHCDNFERNAFSLEDNRVFKSLAVHPVFIFHKYKTFMKYILTNAEVYRSLAHLNIGSNPCIDNFGCEYSIHERLIHDETERTLEIRNTLIGMSDFTDFMEEHGLYTFELLQEEFSAMRLKYKDKISRKPGYNRLVNALDSDFLEQQFNQLCLDCGMDYIENKPTGIFHG